MRLRFVLVATAATLMVALAFVLPLGLLIRTLARDRALDVAEREAFSLVPVLAVTEDPAVLDLAVAATEAGREARISVFLPDDRTAGASATPDDRVELARRGRSFAASAPGGVHVLVPAVLGDGSTAVVRVFVPGADLRRGVVVSWVILAGLGTGLVALAAVVADRLARSITRPLDDLVAAAGRLGRGELDAAGVEPEGPPEIAGLARTFNQMAGRIRELVAAEREGVADLSHRLRTPLTTLRLDAEAVPDPDDAARLAADVRELERAVDQLIEESRRPVTRGTLATSDLGEVATERARYWGALADDQGRRWTLDLATGPHPVPLGPREAQAVLDAVLGNVFAHTPEGTPFRVRVVVRPDGMRLLVVEDEGPGIASEHAVQRGVSASGSTGLGLDITRRAAEAAGGRLRVENRPEGGARVEIELPPAGA